MCEHLEKFRCRSMLPKEQGVRSLHRMASGTTDHGPRQDACGEERRGAVIADPRFDTEMTPQELIRGHFVFAALTEDERLQVLKCAVTKSVAKNQVLFRKGDPGDGLYGVLSGRVLVVVDSADGKELILNSHGRGEFFGEIALFDSQGRSAGSVAAEVSQLLFLRRDDFLVFLRQRPETMVRIISLLCNRLRRSTNLVEDAAFLSVSSRLAKQVVALIDSASFGENQRPPVSLRISQRELARMLGVSREFVNKQLTIWREAGIIDLGRNLLVVRDMGALEQLVGSGQRARRFFIPK